MATKYTKVAERPWNTPQELAEKWKVKVRTIRRYIRSGKLVASWIGGGYRISPMSALAFEKATRIIVSGGKNLAEQNEEIDHADN